MLGDWERNVRKVRRFKWGDPTSVDVKLEGVRALIVPLVSVGWGTLGKQNQV
jgi:hypothetical protein